MDAVLADYQRADVPRELKALLGFSRKLGRSPGAVQKQDLAELMASGVSRESIRDATRVTGLFSFYNRWIDGSGVPEMDPASYAASAKGLATGGYGPPASPVRPLRQPVRPADLAAIARDLAAGKLPRRLTAIAGASPGLAAFTGRLLSSSSQKLPRPLRRTIAALAFGEPLGLVDADALVAAAGSGKDRALLEFVRTITSRAHDIDQADIDALGRAGWSDRSLYDAITIAALFSNYTRTLHVESLLADLPAGESPGITGGGR